MLGVGRDDPDQCYQCHDPVCYNKDCGAACTPLAIAGVGSDADDGTGSYACNQDKECVDTVNGAAATFVCPQTTTSTMNPDWVGKPGTACDGDDQCGSGLKCLEQEGQLFGPFAGLFSVAQVCTATCEQDSDCERGSCTEEDGLSGMLSGILGHAKLCVATCDDEDDCFVGENCVERENDAIFGGLFGTPTRECVPVALECDGFNNGAGCARGESCLPQNDRQSEHAQCLGATSVEGEDTAARCFVCVLPDNNDNNNNSAVVNVPPWLVGVWDGAGSWLDGGGGNIFDAFGGVKRTTTNAPTCVGCDGRPGGGGGVAGGTSASSSIGGGGGDGGGDGGKSSSATTTIAVAVSVGVVVVAVVIAVAAVSLKKSQARRGGGGGGGGTGPESYTNPGYGQVHGNAAPVYTEEGARADQVATSGYMDIPAPRDGMENPGYMVVDCQGDNSASTA